MPTVRTLLVPGVLLFGAQTGFRSVVSVVRLSAVGSPRSAFSVFANFAPSYRVLRGQDIVVSFVTAEADYLAGLWVVDDAIRSAQTAPSLYRTFGAQS